MPRIRGCESIPQFGNSAVRQSIDSPLLFAALSFCAGILAARYCWRGPWWWAAALAVFAFSAVYYAGRRTAVSAVLVFGAFAAGGGLCFAVRQFHLPGVRAGELEGREVVLTAHVIREGGPRAGDAAAQSVDLETETIALGPEAARRAAQPAMPRRFGAGRPLVIRLRATIYSRARDRYSEEPPDEKPGEKYAESGGTDMPALQYGARLRIAGILRSPHNFRNPGAFDYREYLAGRGISFVIAAPAEEVQPLAGFAGSRAGLWRSRVRRSLLARIHALWPEPDSGLLSAMLISERSRITPQARLDFQRSGTYHLLVVAGLHLGIVAWFCYGALRKLRFGEMAAAVATIAFACGYAWLADDGVPIWRATLMLSLYLVARLLYRPHAALNAIGGAALLLLALDPAALFAPGFQLSFAAVLGIVAVAGPLLENTAEPYLAGLRHFHSTTFDIRLPPRVAQFRLDLRLLVRALQPIAGAWLARLLVVRGTWLMLRAFELVVVSLVMQFALALPMAWYFHRAAILSPAANLLAVPLAGLMLPAAFMAVLSSYASAALAAVPASAASAALHLITRTTGWLGGVFDVRLATPSLRMLAAWLAAFAAAAILVRGRRWLPAAGLALFALASCFTTLVAPPMQRHPGSLEFTSIDVGQGDSLLVVSPGGRTLLVDAGGALGPERSEFDFGEEVVAPYLWSRGIRTLDAVALTHAHRDHIGGMRAILADFHPRELWVGAAPATPAMRQLLAEARRLGVAVRHLAAGMQFPLGEATVHVLAPLPGYEPGERASNNDSLVLAISHHGATALLAGDIEAKIERQLAEGEAWAPAASGSPGGGRSQSLRADVLKIAHHGSATSSTPEFLERVQPRFAVISAGFRNSFGHPRPEVLERLEENAIATYRTDSCGLVSFYLNAGSVKVETCGEGSRW
ncbi:MAG: ComEC/Rec2 family competence protein [Acidobacteria bacterium]|nr:ComEC/Rec2 family competence protein [Acidobacteriota bacterium]